MSILPHALTLLADAAARGAAHVAAAAAPTTLPSPVTPAPPTTAPTSVPASLLTAAVLLLPAVFVAGLTGVFRRGGGIDTPDRIEPQRSALPLLLVTFLGGGVWLLSQIAYGAYAATSFQHAHPGQKFGLEHLGPYDFAFLSTVPALAGLLFLLAGDRVTGLSRRLGYRVRLLPAGIGWGVVAAVGVLPLMWSSGIVLDLFYRAVRFSHPQEHELLGAMKDAPHEVRMILIIGACVAAPMFEELLFRGHVQTLLGRLFAPARRPVAPPPLPIPVAPVMEERVSAGDGGDYAKTQATEGATSVAAPVAAPAPGIAPVAELAAPEAELERSRSQSTPRRAAWLAIVITSILFALVHPMWMAPLIFVLALCLGYLYERTGNLWACIALHAIFNASSTVAFLNM
jgi:membrane protease YdiL (CAAX protease family)